ncbi:hypothetical protein O181_095133 [Austropuccinia psidii MF-1]|uniref:Reverse transcriptase n=1 Tax=Austropuccinia psidii MF-1 TaxID=1389203 RepID=A0A9Q3J4H0_9BASI|nr:hypothetical protein [Austropuccinia psidii MF-1]
MLELLENIPLFILDSNESTSPFITHYTKCVVDFPSFPSFECDFFIIYSSKGEDLILVYEFLYHFNLIIDCKNVFITYDSGHKDSSGITSSTSNDFSTAVNSVALVGELKTPSLPPSVHIPSIIPFQGYGVPHLSFQASLEEQWDEEEEPEEIETVLKVVPPAYNQYLDVFFKVKAEKLPPHCACDHHTELEGLLPPVGVIYSLSKNESETLQAYISQNKTYGGLCLCFDYRKLNAVTRKNRYAVPPMNQLLTAFKGSTIFFKIDLCGAYNLLRIKEGDEHLTAFRTKYSSYEYSVMLFGLTNSPASFQNLLNDIFSDFLDIFVVVYLDDIMVFSISEEGHVKHVASVLQRLRGNNLFAKSSKCVFHASSVEYLGYVSSGGLNMDSSKVQRILNWPQQENIKALQSFLGFANFYCHFIKNYSKKNSSLTSLLKKDSSFIFNEEALSQFQILKEAFTISPILSHFNPSLLTIVDTDASDYALGAVLCQVNDSGKNPIEFDSHKLLPAKLNYEIHDKELLGIFWALQCWRDFLLSLSYSFEVFTDHSSLQYFMSSKPRKTGHFTRLLVTLGQRVPKEGADFISKNPPNFHQVLKQSGIKEEIFFSIKTEVFSDLVNQIQKAVWQDKYYKEILKQLARGESVSDYTLEPQAKLLLFKDRVVIPRNHELQLDILQKHHDSLLADHPGQDKTLKLIKSNFYWAGMNKIIKDYVSSCQKCSRSKNINHKKFGLLKPLQIPSGPWKSLSMDFITQLPLSSKFDSILAVLDIFSKMAIFIPTYSTITALDLAQIFIINVFSKHGLPSSIVSDRGSLFVSLFWTQFCQQLKISRNISTAFHPERDGQTERVNKILEQYLWMYVSYHQYDWYTWLPPAEFAYNNAEHSSTKQSPFFTIY